MAIFERIERTLGSWWLSPLCFSIILVAADAPWAIAIPALCVFVKWDTALQRGDHLRDMEHD